ncbi:TetR/AcrR family transcriptional regulator C-terminal domain-containing protein [Streptomyces oceani]|uniref:TetR/AcrR family transcriptional regulator C-terminal domain-containing protein n=1 Tax=Streptomyces oceani TaxID=1075402 RepID=UPI000871E28D|nr:TetR/AcrR family transcriptional regulator C-terminal domain-containing protein [Streptomyces oceani]
MELEKKCVECGRAWKATPHTGRPRRYCSRSCQARAYRRRRDRGRLSTSTSTASGTGPVGERLASVLELGVTIADTEGVAAVTLRTVAHRSGLPLASVERDFRSRDRLVAAMAQRLLARPARRGPGTGDTAVEDAGTALRRLAEEEWRVYRTHPWLVEVLASTRPPLVPAVLDTARDALAAFTRIGLDSHAALRRYLAYSAYVQGMALLLLAERRESEHSGTSFRHWWREEGHRLDRTGATVRHAWLAELTASPPAGGFNLDAAFRDGLDRTVRALTTEP